MPHDSLYPEEISQHQAGQLTVLTWGAGFHILSSVKGERGGMKCVENLKYPSNQGNVKENNNEIFLHPIKCSGVGSAGKGLDSQWCSGQDPLGKH